jgi:hypothetical protein
LAGHLADQPLNPSGLQERGRRFRLRIGGGFGALQRGQAGDLVLLVLGRVNPAAGAGRPRAQAAAIHLDDDRRGRARHPRRQLAAAAFRGLFVTPPGQVGADLVGQFADVAGRDGQAGQAHGEGGVGEGAQPGGGGDDLLQDGRAVAVALKPGGVR